MDNPNYFRNLEVIARGGGSPQARHEGCPICEEEKQEENEIEQNEEEKKPINIDSKVFLALIGCPTLKGSEISYILSWASNSMSFTELAEYYEVSKQAIEHTIKRGLKKLKEFYTDYGIYEEIVYG